MQLYEGLGVHVLRLLLKDQRRLSRETNPQFAVVRGHHALGVGAHALPSAVCRILQTMRKQVCSASGMGASCAQATRHGTPAIVLTSMSGFMKHYVKM